MSNEYRREAIEDCRWARGLSEAALTNHLENWSSAFGLGDLDYPYYQVICEIKDKLDTEECLLKEETK